MFRFIYTLLLVFIAPILLIGLYKKKPGRPPFGARWKEHFGITPRLPFTESPLWIHAVSVGEVIAASVIIKRLKQENPTLNILVTTTTSTGAEQVAKLGELVEHRYMPLDFPFAINGFLRAVKPISMLIMETELWPNTLHCVKKAGVPISILNARLSERSCNKYQKVQPIFNSLAKHIDLVLCQNQSDAERFISLGIEEGRVKITGSVKFDITISDSIKQQGQALKSLIGPDRPVWIAASTHDGEDEQVLQAHKTLLNTVPDALLILVPRHPERFSNVTDLATSYNLKVVTRTSNQPVDSYTQVYIGDTMGEMLTLIGASDICFMGGSLIGKKVGGHNVLEPAALEKPVITGPSYFNFQEITEMLLTARGAVVVNSPEELANQVSTQITSKTLREQMGENAYSIVQSNRGAVSQVIQYISKV